MYMFAILATQVDNPGNEIPLARKCHSCVRSTCRRTHTGYNELSQLSRSRMETSEIHHKQRKTNGGGVLAPFIKLKHSFATCTLHPTKNFNIKFSKLIDDRILSSRISHIVRLISMICSWPTESHPNVFTFLFI